MRRISVPLVNEERPDEERSLKITSKTSKYFFHRIIYRFIILLTSKFILVFNFFQLQQLKYLKNLKIYFYNKNQKFLKLI